MIMEIEKILEFNISAQFLKHIINLQRTAADEGKITFDKEKIALSNVDPGHVMMILQEIPIQCLNEYRINDDLELGFDYGKLQHMLKSISKKDNLIFDLDAETNKANIKIGLFKHLYSFMDIAGMPDPKIPKLELPSSFRINTKLFYDFLVQAERITDHITISTTRNALIFFAEGDIDTVKVELDKDELEHLDSPGDFRSLFSIDYLLNAFKNLKPLFDSVKFSIGNDNPTEIIGDDKIKIRILLAPKIENE